MNKQTTPPKFIDTDNRMVVTRQEEGGWGGVKIVKGFKYMMMEGN